MLVDVRHGKMSMRSTHMPCSPGLLQRLSDCPATVPKFDFQGQAFYGRLVKLYDADTVTIVTELFDKLYTFNIRLLEIDTPEIKSKDPKEKALAVKARDCVAAWALPSKFKIGGNYTEAEIKAALRDTPVVVFVRCEKNDLYGRCLAHLYKDSDDEQSVSQLLIQQGLADPYHGETKLRSWAR